jgi:hypothetical protein
MLRRRLGAAVSTMIVAIQLGTPVAAQPTVDQLVEIKKILVENDVVALQLYLERYPELLEGDTQLAELLRMFLLQSKHLPNYLLSDSGVSSALDPADLPPSGGSPGDPENPDDGIY